MAPKKEDTQVTKQEEKYAKMMSIMGATMVLATVQDLKDHIPHAAPVADPTYSYPGNPQPVW